MDRMKFLLFWGMASVLISACQPRLFRFSYRPEVNFAPPKSHRTQEQAPPHGQHNQPVDWEVNENRSNPPEPNSLIESHTQPPERVFRDKPNGKKKNQVSPKPTFRKKLEFSASKKPKKSNRKPLFRPNNDGFWIGGGLLGIAMLLSVLNFPSLALLFGLVSLLFFIFAIKKLVRRNRRRQRLRSKRNT